MSEWITSTILWGGIGWVGGFKLKNNQLLPNQNHCNSCLLSKLCIRNCILDLYYFIYFSFFKVRFFYFCVIVVTFIFYMYWEETVQIRNLIIIYFCPNDSRSNNRLPLRPYNSTSPSSSSFPSTLTIFWQSIFQNVLDDSSPSLCQHSSLSTSIKLLSSDISFYPGCSLLSLPTSSIATSNICCSEALILIT